MPVWRFRSTSITYPARRLLECVLRARGLDRPGCNGNLYSSPFDITGMDRIARRLVTAVSRRERVLVFGDYDCDGICSAYIMANYLNRLGARTSVYFPNRHEGYGIQPCHIDSAREQKYDLIVTVDNGIAALPAAEAARRAGIDLIITDHHEPPEVLPCAPATNPKLTGSRGYRELSGAGVVYKACCAVSELLGREAPQEFLDLVSLATVVDMCPVTGENFVLARAGLMQMRKNPRPGIAAVLSKAGVSRITGHVMSWVIGPRINVAGRMSDPMLAYRLIAAGTIREAESVAEELEQLRKRRQEAVKKVTETCLNRYDQEAFALFASPEWMEGIIGIVAGRVSETIMRPTAVGSICGDKIKFSARAPGDFNLVEALEECQQRDGVLLTHGGHRAAAGFSLRVADFPVVRQTLNEIALNRLKTEDTVDWLDIDVRLGAVPAPDEVRELDTLEPHGNKNPIPTFYIKDYAARVKEGPGWCLVRTASGLKFFSSRPVRPGSVVHTALTLAVDEYKGTVDIIGHALDVRSFICDRQNLLERYLAWRKGRPVAPWAERIFNELGLSRTGNNAKTTLLKSPTFLKYGFIKI